MTRSEYQTLINTLMDNQPNTAATVRGIFEALADGATFTNELKLLDTTNLYITDNFDGSGLGINEMLGYAICNGQNGTRDWGGRVPLAYDDSLYPTLGAIGGSKDAVVVSHTHTANGFGASGSGLNGLADNNFFYGQISETTSAGESGTNKNLQPYRVVLYVMKL
jgi:hypothetical protein